eukprot:s2829_g9.t1
MFSKAARFPTGRCQPTPGPGYYTVQRLFDPKKLRHNRKERSQPQRRQEDSIFHPHDLPTLLTQMTPKMQPNIGPGRKQDSEEPKEAFEEQDWTAAIRLTGHRYLSEGSTARIYKGVLKETNEIMAWKVLRPERQKKPGGCEGVLQGSRNLTLCRASNLHIARVFLFSLNPTAGFALELCGPSLANTASEAEIQGFLEALRCMVAAVSHMHALQAFPPLPGAKPTAPPSAKAAPRWVPRLTPATPPEQVPEPAESAQLAADIPPPPANPPQPPRVWTRFLDETDRKWWSNALDESKWFWEGDARWEKYEVPPGHPMGEGRIYFWSLDSI